MKHCTTFVKVTCELSLNTKQRRFSHGLSSSTQNDDKIDWNIFIYLVSYFLFIYLLFFYGKGLTLLSTILAQRQKNVDFMWVFLVAVPICVVVLVLMPSSVD